MGYENLIWTVYDPELMLQLIRDPNVGAITTGSPRVLQSVISGFQSFPVNEQPESFQIYQNYPNPFNEMTWIRYSLAEPGEFFISIFDILGREVRTLASGAGEPGYYITIWNGRNSEGKSVGSGAYFAVLYSHGKKDVRKMVVLK
jgi:hypothetical protein